MRIVSITEAKERLSALLDQVAAGEDVVIAQRGLPVARIVAVSRSYPDPQGRAERLERAGVLTPSRGGSLEILLSHPPVGTSKEAGVLHALLDERAEGR
ncbi:MAG: type II toxin-antitoxin system prevent-host-death family antitoxin [Actinobacteria bacterium]|nr:type II toxin-antitoxin system prevent-host-death family antitoxin [Actinomycetota bacterium]